MSFTHSCAHAHLIPIFPASERYHGSSIVPNKSSSMEGGVIIIAGSFGIPSREAVNDSPSVAVVGTQSRGWEVPLPPGFGLNPPH